MSTKIEIPGWFYSEKFNHYQKVNNEVYAYVSGLIFGWQAQLYLRGDTSYCECEIRTGDSSERGLIKMIETADRWLDRYGDNPEAIKNDRYCIYNPDGVWMKEGKAYWV